MIADWFRPIEITIPFSAFASLPRHAAYKYEYFEGRAVLTPRPCYQRATVDLASFSAVTSPAGPLDTAIIRPLRPEDWPHLATLLAAAFRHVPPLGGLNDAHRVEAALACMRRTSAGDDGAVLAASCFVAADRADAGRLEGAIVITLSTNSMRGGEERPHLTWILVHPWRFGQGLGTRLLGSAATVLQGLGYRELASTFLVGNERSALWHWRNGFRLVRG